MQEDVARLYADIGLKITGALRGLRDFRSRLRSAQGAVKTLRDQAKITATAINIGLTAGLAAMGVKAVGALGDAGQAMSVFRLVTKASAGEMAEASLAVAALSHDLSLPNATAQASAAALAELGKAGLSARDSIDALRPTMLLAAAGGLEGAEAAQILANTLNAFKLPGTDAARIADLLAGAEVAAAGSIRDHAEALQQSMAVFALAKVPVEDLVTSIALLANAGIIGSDAGTSLRTMMLRLISPTEEAAGLMRAMGISVYDAQGRVKPFREVLEQFQKGLAPLTEAQRNQRLETIFGADAIRAAAVIFGGGVQAFDQMKEAVTKHGLAQELATAKTEGLKGSVEGLGKTLDTAMQGAIKPFEEDIKSVTKFLSEAVLSFDSLDDGTKRLIVGFLAGIVVLGAVAGVVAAVGGIVSGLGATVAVVTGIIGAAPAVIGLMGAALAFLAANPVVAIIAVLVLFATWLKYVYDNSETFRSVVDGAFSAVASAVQRMWSVVQPILQPFISLLDTILSRLGIMGSTQVSVPAVQQPPNYGPGNRWAPPASVPPPGGGATAWVNGVPLPGRASGGPVTAGRAYMVGENGPEPFIPGRSGTILPNGGGDVHIHFNEPVYGFSDFEDVVVRATDRARKRWRS